MNDREKTILDAIAAAELIRGQAFEANASLDAIEGARRQLSVATDELRGQTTATKERVTWLIRELDRLAAQVKALQGKP
jgi:uncharacterized membrane protein